MPRSRTPITWGPARRVSSARRSSRALAVVVAAAAFVLAACGSAAPASAPAPSLAASSTSSAPPSISPVPAAATPAQVPSPSFALRPTDLPTDGTCEADHPCLGLLAPGAHRESAFRPAFSFRTETAGWENLAETGGVFGLMSIEHPGDAIMFFDDPRPTSPGGMLVSLSADSVSGLGDWIAANPDLVATPAKPITIGGLHGQWTDITIAPTADNHPGDCPTRACVGFLSGTDRATWAWDWGVADTERMRLYLLDAGKDNIAIVVDSPDGTTFEPLTKEAAAILGTVTFDRS